MSPKTAVNVLVLCFISLSVIIAFGAEKATASTPSNETDRASLLSFKLGITKDPLGIMKSWNDSLNFCQWRGVTCSRRHQRVTTLVLNSSQLSGTLSPYIANLSYLNLINLNNNSFHGEIPHELGNLFRLSVLNFMNNSFQGEIPVNLSQCSNLIAIRLGFNKLRGNIPMELSSLLNIERLNLHYNNLTGTIPSWIGNLSSLTTLSVAGNSLTGTIPETIATTNKLRGSLPPNIGLTLPNLRDLGISDNQFSGEIPKGIEIFTNLNELGLETNFLTGIIPNSLRMLSSLQRLYLNGNKLSGPIPSSIGNLTHLFDLMLANNNLGGKIPSSLGKCQQLQTLSLFNNELNGSIPGKAISFLTSLFQVNLSDNSLTGSLPIEIGSLQNLGTLSISNNDLIGEIPSSLGNCISMETIELQGNNLQGTVPSSLSSLRGIRYLDLSRNNLSDRIPEYFENFSLSFLNLSFNNFEGEVPIRGIFRNHSKFSIGGNRNLCGGIQELQLPSCPVNLSNKRKMSLIVKILIILLGTLFITTILVCAFLWRRKSERRKTFESFPKGGFLRISYKELLEATNGFNHDNLIGVGNFGSVFKGVLEGSEKPIAVKVLNLQQKGGAKSFLVECRTLKEVRHRNLMQILSTCSSMDFKGNDFKTLVFELMPNGSLDSWLHPTIDQERVLNFCQRLDIAIGVASALDYLHHYSHIPIAHSDLKPSNVLLGEDMIARVTDFGLAKFLYRSNDDPSHNEMSSSAIKGSIGYIPPGSNLIHDFRRSN